jgi:phosphatidylethanolamine-binding protein (PEBP) family uncharacterized protein
MKKSSLCLATVAALALAAMPARAVAFGVRFSWAGIPACAKISPAFTLAGVPAGTKMLSFVMHDLDVPGFHHGGSSVAFTGDTVAQGAIKYIGPCPPGGAHHRYRWSIEARDASGKVIATTATSRTFPP